MIRHMSRGAQHANARDNVHVAVHELQLPARDERLPIAGEIAGGRTFVGVRRVRMFAALDDISRPGKAWAHNATLVDPCVAACVVEVEVRINDQRDVGDTVT